ncbi:MAG TPA: dTDP-4-dehydrorhamnose reductase [Candidatus Bipolaricaulota bacterium]|nr:dTDP-4-dehydrorhamnose reductase [Candidatus Bipolaricaulota bacterium]
MKILIIGSNGMLGQDLAKVFEKESPILFDRKELDITDRAKVIEKISELNPDVIINSAAYNAVDDCETNFGLAQAINAAGPGNLAAAAKRVGATLVHFSTDYVFSGENKKGYREDAGPEPISAYGLSKFLGEEQVRKKYFKHYLIRTSRLFGKQAKSEGAKKSFVDVMLYLADQKDSLDLVDEEFSNPTYSKDLAERVKIILEEKPAFGTYHATNSGSCTWHGFGKEIFSLANKKIKINQVGSDKFPRPAKRPAYSSLINTKLPALRTWQEALKDYLEILGY